MASSKTPGSASSRVRQREVPRYLPPHLRTREPSPPPAEAPLATALQSRDPSPIDWDQGDQIVIPTELQQPTEDATESKDIIAVNMPPQQTQNVLVTPPLTRSSKKLPDLTSKHQDVQSSCSHRSSVTTPKADLVVGLLGKKAKMLTPKRRKTTLPARMQAKSGGWIKSSQIPKGDKPRKKQTSKWLRTDVKSRLSGWLTKSGEASDGSVVEVRQHIWTQHQPPALDWDDREPFDHSDLHKAVNAWRHDIAASMSNTDMLVKLDSDPATARPIGSSSAVEGWLPAIVPAYWEPSQLDSQSLELFWKSLVRAKPRTIDKDDLSGVLPWWKQFPPHLSPCQQIYTQPALNGIDPDETTAQRSARLNDYGADHTIARLRGAAIDKLVRPSEKSTGCIIPAVQKARRETRRQTYIREANREDMKQICAIYNHYINFSTVIDETEPLSDTTVSKRWRKAQAAGLPMLVACDAAYTIKDRRKAHRGLELTVPEMVVGVVFVSDYTSRREVYRHTKRVQVFVHAEHYRRGIAKCMVDKLLALLDSSYQQQLDCIANVELDKSRIADIRSLVVNYLYDSASTERLQIVSKWLTSMYGFQSAAKISNIAWKHDKRLSLAVFQRDIGAKAAANSASHGDSW